MDSATSLAVLQRHASVKFSRFNRRIQLLKINIDDNGRQLNDHQKEAEAGHLVINIQTYWSNWSRAFYISGCLGATTVTGGRLSSTIAILNPHHAITVAIRGTLPTPQTPSSWPSQKEPKWHLPNELASVITRAQLNNAPILTAYLHSAPNSISHLRSIRNYYAHRCELLKRDALSIGPQYLIGRASRPSDILFHIEQGRSVTVIERWITDLTIMSAALCA